MKLASSRLYDGVHRRQHLQHLRHRRQRRPRRPQCRLRRLMRQPVAASGAESGAASRRRSAQPIAHSALRLLRHAMLCCDAMRACERRAPLCSASGGSCTALMPTAAIPGCGPGSSQVTPKPLDYYRPAPCSTGNIASEEAQQKYLKREEDFDCARRNQLPRKWRGSYLT